MKKTYGCIIMLVGLMGLSGCGQTTEHVFIDNANKCDSSQLVIAFGAVQNVGSNDLQISPLEVKSAIMQAFDENGCVTLSPSSPNVARATYNTRIENSTQKGFIYSSNQLKLAVEINFVLTDTVQEQVFSSTGYLDVNNEKFLQIGNTHQVNVSDKTYTLSIASRLLSKALSDKLLGNTGQGNQKITVSQELTKPKESDKESNLPEVTPFEEVELNKN